MFSVQEILNRCLNADEDAIRVFIAETEESLAISSAESEESIGTEEAV